MSSIWVQPTGAALGADVHGIDLSQPLANDVFQSILTAWSDHLVLRFSGQRIDDASLMAFSARFGELDRAPILAVGFDRADSALAPEVREWVAVISNVKRDGKAIGGLGNAELVWHTDMSYSSMIAFSNVLYGLRIPVRDGRPLGNTEFCNMHAAYEGLPQDLKDELDGKTITHDFNKFWEMMRREKGSTRPPLTEEQRRRKPPVAHPVFLTHPITGRKVLYANPGYSMRINELPVERSEQVLDFLFKHQLQEKYRYRHRWTQKDVLMWDNMGTIHNAVADYRPDEPRLIKRCQVMADRYFQQ